MDMRREVAQARIHELEEAGAAAVEQMQEDIQDVVQSVWSEYDECTHHVSTFWECPASPFGFCAYNEMEDPCWDECLFCGDPYERK